MDILSRKDQVDTRENNKDVQMLKEELWTRRTTAKVIILRRNKMIEDSDLLEKIQRNNTKGYEVKQELKKGDSLAWKQNGITYMDGQIYIPNNRKIKEQTLQENYNPANVGHLGQ